MIESILLIVYITHLLSLIFIPIDKKALYTYLLIAIGSTIVLWVYWLFEMLYCPSYYIWFTLIIVIPILSISTIILMMKIKFILIDKTLRLYLFERLRYKFLSKSLKLFILITFLFQVFLLFSANKAYDEAKKIDIEYVKNKNILDFYSPFVKEIYITPDTRWSYHRECYLNEWK